MRNLTNRRLIYLKAILFLLAGLLAAVLILVESPTLRAAVLLTIAIWCFARAYYFAFYVIEHYVDPQFKFAGLWSVVRYWMQKHRTMPVWVLTWMGLCATAASAQELPFPLRPPGAPGTVENPIKITAKDMGPQIDPVKVAASKYSCVTFFPTFGSFTSAAYAISGVWIYAENDDPALYNLELSYAFPEFYSPTWGEVFDLVARKMKCTWDYTESNRQFRFARSNADPFFGVTLADKWRREDRGEYIWHAPPNQGFGMDIYFLGHYTSAADDPDLHKKVRSYFANKILEPFPNKPTEQQMTEVKIAGKYDALFAKVQTPAMNGNWRQWSFIADGNAFMIVSALPFAREAELLPAVEKMIATFHVTPLPATRPSTQPGN